MRFGWGEGGGGGESTSRIHHGEESAGRCGLWQGVAGPVMLRWETQPGLGRGFLLPGPVFILPIHCLLLTA